LESLAWRQSQHWQFRIQGVHRVADLIDAAVPTDRLNRSFCIQRKFQTYDYQFTVRGHARGLTGTDATLAE
jgi:hypothetical protein